MTFRSPNEILAAAKEQMLGGRKPVTQEDYQKVLNFVAYNTAAGLEEDLTPFFAYLYGMPVDEPTCREIGRFQARRKSQEGR